MVYRRPVATGCLAPVCGSARDPSRNHGGDRPCAANRELCLSGNAPRIEELKNVGRWEISLEFATGKRKGQKSRQSTSRDVRYFTR